MRPPPFFHLCEPMSSDRAHSLDDIIITPELDRRPSRSPDRERENAALVELMELMARQQNADDVLQGLVETALKACQAQSAGVSILETNEQGREVFRWRAATGQWPVHRGDEMPRASPCGAV